MRVALALSCLLLVTAFAACDFRSDTAKREMEKFSGTPTPPPSPVAVETPPDPSDVDPADVNLVGETISVSGDDQKKTVACAKLDRVMVNGAGSVVTIKGPCRQIMINGDSNQVISDAAIEFVVNGRNNNIKYSRDVNGKHPLITDNADGNSIEKIAARSNTK